MKRAMTLIVVIVVLLFSQLAIAEVEFKFGELTEIIQEGGAQNQGFIYPQAAGLRIVPLMVWTSTDIYQPPDAFWAPNESFFIGSWFRVYGSGTGTIIVTITDVKTGRIVNKIKFEEEFFGDLIGIGVGPSAFIGTPSTLTRKYNIKFSFKVGTTVKSISTNVMVE